MRRCPKCETLKPRADFYTGGYCKSCTKADVARWQRENPEQFRRTQRRSVRKRKYGLTEDDVTRMLAGQRDRCLICRAQITAENLNVDHDHATGKVRGLLCARCNRTIGLLKDDPKVIRSAIRYLSRRREVPEALF